MSPIEQLMDKLGAEIAVRLKPYQPLSLNRLVILRNRVDEEIENIGGSVPLWANRQGADQRSELVVVWDKPVPWRAGHLKYLTRTILGAGTWEDQVSHLWAYPIAQDQPPLISQLPKYRDLLIRQLQAADTRYVLCVGAVAMSVWRGDLKLAQVQGYSGVLDERWVIYPIANPASVLRDPMLQGGWRLDLYNFMDMVRNQEEFRLMTKCVTKDCTEGVLMYDKDGIGWCKRHWKKGVSKAENKQARTRKAGNVQNHDQLDL